MGGWATHGRQPSKIMLINSGDLGGTWPMRGPASNEWHHALIPRDAISHVLVTHAMRGFRSKRFLEVCLFLPPAEQGRRRSKLNAAVVGNPHAIRLS